ncbi:nuclear receptor subfamily 5, group A, member 5 [Triplophysa rosa]|uniref:Nuclear receptor subfamily 5 n=1 Tax=Triplophysa rosa TaxID=992332 RepID=A0A9W7WL71_TRIRA|nr:nuclear receptor subfamily 5, group A, member 5 [Triplophysa rosa]KAI7803656.1 nuclear receptor subfamily 5 [Triplophysa rosa]
MNIPHYLQDHPQPTAFHPTDHTRDIVTQEAPLTSQDLKPDPDGRAGQEGCPVCGDRVSGYHYGLLTCESCKGFFKRSVQNNKRYMCAERQNCPMDPAQRKRCPYCRFQKCLAVGMKREAVRADRMRGGRNKFGPLYRQDRQMKQQRGSYHTANSAPYRVKQEGPQSSMHHDFPLSNPSPATPDHYHPPQPFPPSISQSEFPMLLDCTIPRDRTLSDPSLSFHTLYYPGFHGYPQEKRDLTLNYSPASTLPSAPISPTVLTTPVSTPASTPSSTPNPHSLTPTVTPNPISCFLSQLLQAEPDEKQLCMRVLASLQREQACRGKHDRLNTFSIMCKMADQTLFGLVEWARNSTLFKDLKVEDQMGLLQSCWSELLILDHLCRQVAYGRDGRICLITGQQIEVSIILSQAGVTLSSLVCRTQDLVSKLKSLQLDREEFVCLKYLVLFNPDVKSVQDRRQVEQTQERVNRALMDHTMQTHPGHSDKFGQLLLRLPEVRSISLQVEEYLYQRHLLGDLPCNSLLTEMLHAKHT